MNQDIRRLLENREDNHVLPFFWQHGEDEKTLREMMAAIHGANCGAVCIESRPHPDYCGDKWWQDMDVILDEARKRGMKVWILDDSHFPTGFANGAMKTAPAELCRQSVFMCISALPREAGAVRVNLRDAGMMNAPKKIYDNPMMAKFFDQPPARSFEDDQVLSLILRQKGQEKDVTAALRGEEILLEKPEGEAELLALVLSRNAGYHRDYINMTQKDSVRVLIDTVYEAHWRHYADDFGKTIVGFFSDEPELGNGFMYDKGNVLGKNQDLPWGRDMAPLMRESLGEDWRRQLFRLWEGGTEPETARVRYMYMDALTRLVERNFSRQIGDWCRAHGVMYIGHVIEDDGQHCRTGSSLGHYFRGLRGQDMAGIDDIGGQVLPQGEDEPKINDLHSPRDGTFYHYGLAKLAQSAAALEPEKQGRAMCEIFGNYGWQEGVRLEKYLADHFLVRGINYFVPHAFSGLAFPDPDCPPHFYAHGHNPQYRHFGCLMKYMNRAATLTSSGKHRVPVAVLYHGEGEWSDPRAMAFERIMRPLYDAQIDSHVIPADFFREIPWEASEGCLCMNGQRYQAIFVPGCDSLCASAAEALEKLAAAGVPVIFAGRKPGFVTETGEPLPEHLASCPVRQLSELPEAALKAGVESIQIVPANDRIRLLDIQGDTRMIMVVNEGTEPWEGRIRLPDEGWFVYDPWDNACREALWAEEQVALRVEPLKSFFLVSGGCDGAFARQVKAGEEIPLTGWQRSTCEGAEYPRFSVPVATALPDGAALAEAKPEFSGYVRYECAFHLEREEKLALCLMDAAEGVEVFLNGESAGIQIAPPFEYELKGRAGENILRIEVASTLERECYPLLEGYRKMMAPVPESASGITGEVKLYLAKA